MHKLRKYSIIIMTLCGLIAVGMAVFWLKDLFIVAQIPQAVPYEAHEIARMQDPVSDETLPLEVNLHVPFVLQAPHHNWSLPYQQFCEEASVLMVESYINDHPILNADDANEKMLAIMDFEMKKFGFYEDTNIQETSIILREHYGITKVTVVDNPTIFDIKSALARGRAVIVPLAGRRLGNPYYQQPGPIYHMLVIKGYTKDGDFITNDPGTKMGADYIYKAQVIMDAIHDWNTDNIEAGKKVILVVG